MFTNMNRNLLLGLIFVLCLVSFISPSLAWWDSNWQYRKPITINNTQNSNSLTDYQILVTVDTATLINDGKMKSDCGDIRFVDSDDSTKLSYWIESGCNSANTKIWVKVPSIPASSTKTIYMYYGNPSASSESNGEVVFEFFDDFEGDAIDTSKWGGNIADFSISNSIISCSESTKWIYTKTFQISDGIVEAKVKIDSGARGSLHARSNQVDTYNDTNVNSYSINYRYPNGDVRARLWTSDGETILDAASYTHDTEWHIARLILNGSQITFEYEKLDGSNKYSYSTTDTTYSSGYIGLATDGMDSGAVYYDWVRVRKYTDPEPTTSVGSESVYVQITIYSPENKTYYTTNIEVNVSTYYTESYTCNITNDGNLIGTANETSPNFTTTITNTGGSHNVSVKCITDSGYESNKTVNYYVWMGLNISVYYNDTGKPAQNWSLTITNGTATYTAKNLSNPTMLEWDEIPYGTINVTVDDGSDTLYYFPNTTQVVNNESTYTILNLTLYLKPLNEITLTASPSWNVLEGQFVTISCSVSEGTPTLKVDNVIVSNPYTFTATVGSHSVVCSIGETDNYRPNEESKTLVVNPLVACTNNLTFAFSVTITTSTDITSLNFTKFVEMHYVKPDLSDVWVPNASEVWINTTNGYYLVVNTTGLSEFKVYFGNYFVNNSYSTHAVQNLKEIESYKQENIYAIYKLLDEVTGQESHPPNATLMAFVSCSYGSNYIFLEGNETQYLIALKDYPIKTSVRVQYTADSYYSRVLYPSRKESYVLNFYLVDAYKYPLDRIDFIMRDTRYYNSRLQIYKEIANQTIIITEGYFDASHSISLYLMEDCDYYIRTLNSDGTYTEFGIISVVEPTTKELGKTTISLNPQAISLSNYVTMNAWTNDDRTNLYIEYSDSLQNTSEVKIAIYFSNGTLFKEVTYYNTSSIDLTYDIGNYTDESFEVKFSIRHSNFGNQTYVMFLYPSGFWNLGISSLWYNLFAMGILIMLGGIATRRSVIGGVIVFMLGLVLFEIIGWLSLPLVAIAVIVLLGILAIMIYFKQGGE